MFFLFETVYAEAIKEFFLLCFHMSWVYYVHSRVQMPETASWGPRLGNFPEIQNSGSSHVSIRFTDRQVRDHFAVA